MTKINNSGYSNSNEEKISAGLSIKKNVLTVSTKFTDDTIDLTKSWASGVTKVNASALKNPVNIIGTAKITSIKTGKGNDTILGGSGNNTLTGGAGKDIFVHEGGNDIITDYKTGDDTIKLIGGNVIQSSISGSNIVLATANGNITVKNAKGKKVTVIDGAGNTTSEIYGRFNYSSDKREITLSSAFTGSLKSEDYSSTVKKNQCCCCKIC